MQLRCYQQPVHIRVWTIESSLHSVDTRPCEKSVTSRSHFPRDARLDQAVDSRRSQSEKSPRPREGQIEFLHICPQPFSTGSDADLSVLANELSEFSTILHMRYPQ